MCTCYVGAYVWLPSSQVYEGLGSDPKSGTIPLAFDLDALRTYEEIANLSEEDRKGMGNVVPVYYILLAHKVFTFFSDEHNFSQEWPSYEEVMSLQRGFRDHVAHRLYTDKLITSKLVHLGGTLATLINGGSVQTSSEKIKSLAAKVTAAADANKKGRLSILDDDNFVAPDRVEVPKANFRAAAIIRRHLTEATMESLAHAMEWNMALQVQHFLTDEGTSWWERTMPLLKRWRDAVAVPVKPE